ncbi:MAG TPA: tetratricopeptide repeat protein [Candidatus Acidoferrales bacterium]|nr:tetratricopeptide repeat protein [Candidatus Acidoferrales bacterium]
MTRLRPILLLVLFFSAVYLYAFPSATLFYAFLVLLHLAGGSLLAVMLLPLLFRGFRRLTFEARLGWALLAVGAALGVLLLILGTPKRLEPWLDAHIGFSLAGCVVLAATWARSRGWLATVRRASGVRYALLLLAVAFLAGAAWWTREVRWKGAYVIRNPAMPPATMDGEGDGPQGPFFPSSAQTAHGGKIPAKFFMQGDACQRCHADIYQQWSSSAHRFSSFNNQWYRKSVEYMQDVVGVRPSKWCAGCHDPALLFSGMFDTPVRQIIDRPESHAGLSCVMCHSIVRVKSSTGQGDYVLEYPKLHELAASENPAVRALHDFLVRVNPEPHRRTFLKPFVRAQTAEFCSTCHKVHLDVPVNRYRWVRGFNEYDNWQASGVSGQGARSFYYPAKPQKCVGCHMPLVASRDAGNVGGFVHSHRFPAANSALPFANQDAEQLQLTEKFLQDKIVSVDIFALSPAAAGATGGEGPQAQFSTAFAVGEEADVSGPLVPELAARPLTAPLNRQQASVRAGDTVRVDVVVRTRKVGHFFPAGTVDAFDVWLEFEATDDKGQVLFWSGRVEDDGKGPVEKGAHFYRSLMLDAHGNRINKRNAWANRALVYARLIPPGAADTAHYRLHIPETAGQEIKLKARLNYRKFAWWNTQFAFAGVRDPSQPNPAVTADYDDGRWTFTGDTSHVSGQLKEIPALPVVTLAEDNVTLRVLPGRTARPQPQLVLNAGDWERWNDYGIGLLLQGDLKGAETAFQNVAQAVPENPDGWVNIGRVRLEEGNIPGARAVLEKALALAPHLARAHFFYARVLKAEGRYDEAIGHLRPVLVQYPRDRVVRNELGRILFQLRRYPDAVREFQAVLAVDPEDLKAHYNLMLCYNGLGDEQRARQHQARYLRFKADEAAQAITGPFRQQNPEDNNERQAIHEHISVPLQGARRSARTGGLD